MKGWNAKAFLEKMAAHPRVQSFLEWSKRTSLPGFFKVPLFDVVVFIRNEIRRNTLTGRANAIAFSFFLSIFPSIIVLLTLLPYFTDYFFSYLPGEEDFLTLLHREIQLVMPGDAGEMLFDLIEDITTRPRAGLLSFGFALAVYFASNGMMSMMNSFSKSYHRTFKPRGPLRQRLVAIGLTFLLGALLSSSVVLVIVGNVLITLFSNWIHLDKFWEWALSVSRYITVLGLFYSGIALIYRFGPSVRKRFHFFSAGATLATVLSLLSSKVFSFYVDQFATYNKLYGSIGTIIVFMLWIQLNALILLLGFELNASIAVHRDLKKERLANDE